MYYKSLSVRKGHMRNFFHTITAITMMVILGITISRTSAAPEGGMTLYRIVDTIKLAGNGGWDYCAVDAPSHRLFVTHDACVQVIDVATNKLIGTVSNLQGVHGIAFADIFKKAFISNGHGNSITVVDLESLHTIPHTMVTGTDPDGLVFDPFSQRLFVFNGRSSDCSIFNAATDSLVRQIKLPGKPEFARVDNRGRLYLNIEDKDCVAVINTESAAIEKQWPVAPGKTPSAMAIDLNGHRLFIGCRSKTLVIMDLVSGMVIKSLPIGAGVDAVSYDPVKKLAFCSNGDGTLTIIKETDPLHYRIAQTLVTLPGAKTSALDTLTHHIYLPTAQFGPAPAAASGSHASRGPVKPNSFMVLDAAPVE